MTFFGITSFKTKAIVHVHEFILLCKAQLDC